MNRTVDLDGIPRELARFDRAAMEGLYRSGVLDAIGPVELIDGVLVRMSPSMSPHGYTMMALGAALIPVFKDSCNVGVDIGVFLGETTMRAPDISVVRKGVKPGFLDASDLVLAVEVSATTLDDDLRAKAKLYAAHGIPEYWVVDLEKRLLHVHREAGVPGYADIRAADWSDPVHPTAAPDAAIVLADILDGIV